jgi:hypothetical protein
MRLSRQTNDELQNFFRNYFDDENLTLPKIEIYAKGGAGFITRALRVSGITLGRHILIKPVHAKYDKKRRLTVSRNLLSHEVTHVVQYQQLGFFGFLYKYFKDYLLILRKKEKWDAVSRSEAYWELPHEIEARHAASLFVDWIGRNKP